MYEWAEATDYIEETDEKVFNDKCDHLKNNGWVCTRCVRIVNNSPNNDRVAIRYEADWHKVHHLLFARANPKTIN